MRLRANQPRFGSRGQSSAGVPPASNALPASRRQIWLARLTNGKPSAGGKTWHRPLACVPIPGAPRAAAFSLIELMIVMVLLSVIVLGLLAVFNQTQRAFKTGMAQGDVMEGGRATMDLIIRDLEQMSYAPRVNGSNMINFQSFTPQGYRELTQELPGTTAVRTNILQEFFFLRREQQEWIGTAYFVQDFDLDGVGTLYRFTTNVPARELSPFRDPYAIYRSLTAQEFREQSRRLADGVVHFKVTPFGLDGWALEPGSTWGIDTNNFNVRVYYDSTPSGVRTEFVNGAIPTGMEIELAMVEEEVLQRVLGLPSTPPAQTIRSNYLHQEAGKTHVFKQQVAIRNADERWYHR